MLNNMTARVYTSGYSVWAAVTPKKVFLPVRFLERRHPFPRLADQSQAEED